MPVKTPIDGLRKAQRAIDGAPESMQREIARAVRAELKDEFSRGHDPNGTQWVPRRDGQQPLESRKLPQAFTSSWSGASLRTEGRVKRDWLIAQNEGHRFPARRVGARQVILRYDRRGRLVKQARFEKLKRGRAVFAKEHEVKERVLPARQIVPAAGTLPSRWETSMKIAAIEGLTKKLSILAR